MLCNLWWVVVVCRKTTIVKIISTLQMNNKYLSIFIFLIFSLLLFSCFPQIETNDWEESSVTKYESFISRLKKSGEPSVVKYFSMYILEMERIRKILDLKLSGDKTISNQEAKLLFYKTLALPLQSVCQ